MSAAVPRPPARIRIGSMPFDPIAETACVDHVFAQLVSGRGGRIATVNVNQLTLAARYPEFAAFCERASMILADGMPIVWASRLLGTPLPSRVTGTDLFSALSERAAAEGRSIFLAGGAPDAAVRAAEAFQQRWPLLQIAGTSCPPAIDDGRVALEDVKAELLAARPDLVFVGLPSLKTYHLIAECAHLLPASWWVGVGVSFSFAAGILPRAPQWQQRLGLEWLHRLSVEPGRLASRYLRHDLPAAVRLLTQSAWRRVTG